MVDTILIICSLGQILSLFGIVVTLNCQRKTRGMVLIAAGVFSLIKFHISPEPNPTPLLVAALVAGLIMLSIGIVWIWPEGVENE